LIGGLLFLQIATSGGLVAQEVTPPLDWELTSLTEPTQHLFAAAGGALFASASQRLLRSDDGGATWQPISLPAESTVAAVDPTNADIQYAAGGQGVYRTDDNGATWRLSLRYGPGIGYEVSRLAVSAADHDLLFAGMKDPAGVSSMGYLRSPDGGRTWQVLQIEQPSLCDWSVLLLQPHPMDARRVFRAAACLAGRTFGAPLEASRDTGATWAAIYNADASGRPLGGYPLALAASRAAPGRYYLAANRDARLGGSGVFRSDDDGVTWTGLLAFRGGGTPGFQQPDDDPDAPDVRLGGLVVDPADVERVYVGQLSYSRYPPQDPVAGGVLASLDGGTSWTPLGRDLGGVNDLISGGDGQTLYAATNQGVWRIMPR
jgi:photosystem II stability/assembly factor-like uncharacterized protein